MAHMPNSFVLGHLQGESYPALLRTLGSNAKPVNRRRALEHLCRGDWTLGDIEWGMVYHENTTTVRGQVNAVGIDLDGTLMTDDLRYNYQMIWEDTNGEERTVSMEMYVNWDDVLNDYGSITLHPHNLNVILNPETGVIERVQTCGNQLAIQVG